MGEKTSFSYRGMVLELDKELFDTFERKHGYPIGEEDVDQYLFNESDKTIQDEQALANAMGKERVEGIVNTYMRIENEAWS